MRKLLPVLLALFGTGGGVGAGLLLKPDLPPDPPVQEALGPCGDQDVQPTTPPRQAAKADPSTLEYVRMNNQFIVPIVLDERVSALIVLSLSIEVDRGQTQTVFDREPKLRDAFLQVLFNHANMGGFRGAFTETANMTTLRRALKEAGQAVLGETVTDVLITDLARQDV